VSCVTDDVPIKEIVLPTFMVDPAHM